MPRSRNVGPAARASRAERSFQPDDRDGEGGAQDIQASPTGVSAAVPEILLGVTSSDNVVPILVGVDDDDDDDHSDDEDTPSPPSTLASTASVPSSSLSASSSLPTRTSTFFVVQSVTSPSSIAVSSLLATTSGSVATTSSSSLVTATSSASVTSPVAPSSSTAATSSTSSTTLPVTSSAVTPNSSSASSSSPPSPSKSSSDPTAQATGNSDLASTHGAAKSGSHVSAAAVAVIVIVLLLCGGAVVFFLLRRRQVRKRSLRRWRIGAPSFQGETSAMEEGSVAPPQIIEPFMIGAPASIGPDKPSTVTRKPPPPFLASTPASFPNPLTIPGLPLSPMRTTPVSPQTQMPPSSPDGSPTLVRVTFVRSLPDELAITPGETLQITSRFDDGWALCTNARGVQGMVPLECLEGGGGQFMPAVSSEGRRSRRGSSLRASLRSVG